MVKTEPDWNLLPESDATCDPHAAAPLLTEGQDSAPSGRMAMRGSRFRRRWLLRQLRLQRPLAQRREVGASDGMGGSGGLHLDHHRIHHWLRAACAEATPQHDAPERGDRRGRKPVHRLWSGSGGGLRDSLTRRHATGFAASGTDQKRRIYVRSLDQLQATVLSGTENARDPLSFRPMASGLASSPTAS